MVPPTCSYAPYGYVQRSLGRYAMYGSIWATASARSFALFFAYHERTSPWVAPRNAFMRPAVTWNLSSFVPLPMSIATQQFSFAVGPHVVWPAPPATQLAPAPPFAGVFSASSLEPVSSESGAPAHAATDNKKRRSARFMATV